MKWASFGLMNDRGHTSPNFCSSPMLPVSTRTSRLSQAVEQQAQDRCHRLGQTRACRIVRFVAADSIESRMVDLQEAKAALGKGVFESLSPDEKRKARMSELKKLLEL